MKQKLLELLRCPVTGGRLLLHRQSDQSADEIETGELSTSDGSRRYPIRHSIPRFVPESNYADSFGMQWNRFKTTQLDSVSGLPISRNRFYSFTGWNPEELAGKFVLDVGCGAGRFTEIALDAGARVVAVDYSGAVDACRANVGGHPNLEVIQGDLFALPFEPAQFDFVYCLGVLQHTPDVRKAFLALPPQLKPGGRIAVDLYPWLLRNIAWSKYWIRPITRRLPTAQLFRLVENTTPSMLALSRLFSRVPWIGRYLRYLLPVVNYEGTYPLSELQLTEWAVLDTFDMLAPAHDHPQRRSTVEEWFKEAGLENCSIERQGFLVGRGARPRTVINRSELAPSRGLNSVLGQA
jgi:SAM-dependent methyltransferase